jgi:hypothetical protein
MSSLSEIRAAIVLAHCSVIGGNADTVVGRWGLGLIRSRTTTGVLLRGARTKFFSRWLVDTLHEDFDAVSLARYLYDAVEVNFGMTLALSSFTGLNFIVGV